MLCFVLQPVDSARLSLIGQPCTARYWWTESVRLGKESDQGGLCEEDEEERKGVESRTEGRELSVKVGVRLEEKR